MEQQSYYRSLEQLADTPEFRAFAAEEFPGFANVYESLGEAEARDDDPEGARLNRRKFLALSAAALGLAGLAGCRRPELEILPFAAIPDEQVGHSVPGKPTFYATSLPRPGGALPVLVESHDGRPTKIEGNPQHASSRGSTDAHAQATILDLYSPDRVMSERYPGVMEGRSPRKWDDFDRFARGLNEELAKNKGKALYVLAEQTASPAVRALRDTIKAKFPNISWHTYEPTDTGEALRGAELAFGSKLVMRPRFDRAERILALDCDFLGNEPDSVFHSRAFAEGRKLAWPGHLPAADEFTVTLKVDAKGHAEDANANGQPAKLENATQVEIYLKRKLKEEQERSKGPRVLVVIFQALYVPADAIDPFMSAGKAAGFQSVQVHSGVMSRLYVVESTYTVTGTMADHRYRLPASQIGAYLAALARQLKAAHGVTLRKPDAIPAALPAVPDFDAKWVTAVAMDLAEYAGASLIVVGPRQPAWVHALAHAVNEALGNYAAGVAEFREPPPEVLDKGLKELVADMRDGKVGTLLVVGGNPVFNAPADLRFGDELAKVPRKLRLGLYHDQTSEKCDWHLPLAHPLESWGDTEAGDSTLCCVQPLIAPLGGEKVSPEADTPPRGGRTLLEVLTMLTRIGADGKPAPTFAAAQKAAYGFVRKAFSDRSGVALTDPNFDAAFNRYKQVGFLPVDETQAKALGFDKPDTKARAPKPVKVDAAGVSKALAGVSFAPAPTKDALEVTFHASYSVGDGRFAMNPWLQEMPDPITKLVWDNAALVSPATARELGVKQGDLLAITVEGRSITVPAFVLPGQADWSVALPFGQYGEMRISNVPQGGGTNVFPLRASNAMHTATGAQVQKAGGTFDLVTTQEHGVIPEGRDIIREEPVSRESKTSAEPPSHHHGPAIGVAPGEHITEPKLKKEFQGGYGNPQMPKVPAKQKQERFPLDLARPEWLDSQFQWGMVIDLSACTGCSACVVACQAENNIPVVGKHEVKRNREMHWIRIDRYFSSPNGEAAAEEPRIVSQPVACVHCEAAPCEQVCPVNAAVHSPEGLNLQVYNRCIGTRYCANACPYKVRRFNWFDFNKRRLDELRVPTPFASGGANLEGTGVPETLKMQKNPDVTVRMRGVMEKCTYCVQRIERGKYGAKIAAAEVAQGRRGIEVDANFKPADGGAYSSGYRKPKDPRAAGYDLDALGRVIVPDGVIVTACAAACPTQAITFGNTLDPNSKVTKQKAKESEYLLLGELNTKPRTSYLPRVRNLNPEMA